MSTPRIREIVSQILQPNRIPRVTYRLQFNPHAFSLYDGAQVIDYLAALGISDLYASPALTPRRGSTHGYDIADHNRINPEIGGEDGLNALTAALESAGLGMLLDVVPNHMGVNSADNRWWMDVLENGPSSVYGEYFDIDWNPVKAELRNKVLLPILGDQYGKVLENGELKLAYDDAGGFVVHYYDQSLPLAPRTYRKILRLNLGDLIAGLGKHHETVQEMQSIITALGYLPSRSDMSAERVEERYREKEVIKRRIARLYEASAEARQAITRALDTFNGTPDDPSSYDLLDDLLSAQSYRLAFWRVASEEINYRRFFDINDLAAIRTELPRVFDDTHRLIFALLGQGRANGLRIDHPDGLKNPQHYFCRLQERYVLDRLDNWLTENPEDPDRDGVVEALENWISDLYEGRLEATALTPLYVAAEKILSDVEPLPDNWPVSGTTGYDFMNAVNHLFVSRENARAIDEIYARFIGRELDFEAIVVASKDRIMDTALASEINALSHQLERITERNRRYRDFTLNSVTDALRYVLLYLGIYRTYITEAAVVSDRDRDFIKAAVKAARANHRTVTGALFDFIEDTLLLNNLQDFAERDRQAVIDAVMKIQQVSSPIMAKSVEDTTFYVYNRLVALNEVGGHPDQIGIPVSAFHAQNQERLREWRHSMLSSSTHDTKRAEDTRARISVLSEIPSEWEAAVQAWAALNAGARTAVENRSLPDPNDEYLMYQVMIGALPFGDLTPDALADFRERIAAYMGKAVQEAKVHTSWLNPSETYLGAVDRFVRGVLADGDNPFLAAFVPFQRRVAYFAQFNSLSQTLLKLTSPGVPDIYQGTELWDFSLVDPDNRRPVDYDLRRRLVAELNARAGEPEALAAERLDSSEDGRIKLYVMYRALMLRRDQPEVFAQGDYAPLEVHGAKWNHVVAYARIHEDSRVLTVVPRLTASLMGGDQRPPLGEGVWTDTWMSVPDDTAEIVYRNLYTGEILTPVEREGVAALNLKDVLARFPVALLVAEPATSGEADLPTAAEA